MLEGKPDLPRAPANRGTILSVRGSVIDARFDSRLPAINNILRAGDHAQILIEVWAQLDPHRVRADRVWA